MKFKRSPLYIAMLSLLSLPSWCVAGIYPVQPADLSNHQFSLIAQHTGKCIDSSQANPNWGTPVVQANCHMGSSEIWKFIPAPNGYMISSADGSQCLDVSGASRLNGAPIKFSRCMPAQTNQLWTAKAFPGGLFQLMSVNSQKCASIINASTDDGASLQQDDCSKAANALFMAIPTAKVSAAPLPTMKVSAPLVITQSNTIISNVKITNPQGPCIIISRKNGAVSNVTVKDSDIGPCQGVGSDSAQQGIGVYVTGLYTKSNVSNVTIDNVNIHDTSSIGIYMDSSFTPPCLLY
jgi:hypothetical protein